MNRIMAPSRPDKSTGFAEERRWGPGSAPFGDRNGSSAFLSSRYKYCHNGGMPLSPTTAG